MSSGEEEQHQSRARTVEELSYDHVRNGVLVRKQLDKRVIFKHGAWVTIAYLYQDISSSGAESDRKIALVKYRTRKETGYAQMTGITLSGEDMARRAVATLKHFYDEATKIVREG